MAYITYYHDGRRLEIVEGTPENVSDEVSLSGTDYRVTDTRSRGEFFDVYLEEIGEEIEEEEVAAEFIESDE